MDSCSTFVSDYFCESIHVPDRQRTADGSRYYADLWPCVSAFAAEYFRNLLFPVCDAAENGVNHFYGAKLLWWVMPITELVVASYTILYMVKSNKSFALK